MNENTRILYIDDNPMDRALVRDSLEKEHGGFILTEAKSQAEFEKLINEQVYDLVLSDFNILGYEGLQVLDYVKLRYPQIPVIIVTGTGSETVAVESMKRGAADYVIKSPQHIKRLPKTIHTVLRANQVIDERNKALEALKESEERFRTLYDNAPLPYQSLNEDGSFRDVNPAWLRTMGYERDEIIGKMYKDFLHPNWHDKFVTNFPEFKKNGYIHDVQFRIRHKTGHFIDISFEACVGYHPDGSFKQTYCVFQDITERKRAQDALLKSEKRFKEVVEMLPEAVVETDLNLNVLYMNKRGYDLSGYTEEDLVKGLNGLELLTPKSQITAKKNFEMRFNGQELGMVEYECQKKNGTIIPIYFHANTIVSEGKQTGLRALIVDITERKNAEKAMENQEKKYRLLADNSIDVIWQMDLRLKFTYVSPSIYNMCGFTEEEWLETNLYHHTSRIEFMKMARKILKTIKNYKDFPYVIFETKFFKKNKVEFPVEIVGKILFNDKGIPAGLQGSTRDITTRKLAERALLKSEKRYQKAQTIGHVGNWEYNIKSTKFWASDETKKIFGLKLKTPEFSTEDIEQCIPKRDSIHQSLLDLIEHDTKYDLEYDIFTNDKGVKKTIHSIAELEKDNQGNPLRITGVINDVTAQKKADEQIKQDLREKNILLQEIYHRTKNNMQVVSSMLRMKSRNIEKEKENKSIEVNYIQDTFKELTNKIDAMSLVHQKLYQANDLSKINLKDYTEELCLSLSQSFSQQAARITMKFDLNDVFVLIDSAIPLGLILNELVSNVFKHAIPKKGMVEISIRLFKENNDTINIYLADNGVGIPADMDLTKTGSMGLGTMYALVNYQLKGDISYTVDNGLKWHLKFKDTLEKRRV